MLGTITFFKDDYYFEGDVILRTLEANDGSLDVKVTVLKDDAPWYWELNMSSKGLKTNADVLEEIKRDKYLLYGYSEKMDVQESAHKERKELEKAWFAIDDMGLYEGYQKCLKPERWNGWAIPYFTKETADKIIEDMSDGIENVEYDESAKAYTIQLAGHDAVEINGAVEIDGMELYSIGGFSWAWDAYDREGAEEFREMRREQDRTEKSSVKQLQDFLRHMQSTAHELLDHMGDGNGYDSKFDLDVELNGEKVRIELHADVFNRLEQFIEDTIKEELE